MLEYQGLGGFNYYEYMHSLARKVRENALRDDELHNSTKNGQYPYYANLFTPAFCLTYMDGQFSLAVGTFKHVKTGYGCDWVSDNALHAGCVENMGGYAFDQCILNLEGHYRMMWLALVEVVAKRSYMHRDAYGEDE